MSALARAILNVEAFAAERPDAVRLAELASFASRADAALLRKLRLEMLPDAGTEAEADLWHGPLPASRSAEGVVFGAAVATVLRQRLVARGRTLYDRAWAVTEREHAWLPATLRCEEQLNYLQFSRDVEAAGRAKELVRSAIRSIVSRNDQAVARWAAGALERLPADVRESEEGRMLAAAALLALKERLGAPAIPEGLRAEDLAWLAPSGVPRAELEVRAGPGVIEIGPETAGTPGGETIRVPRLDPMWVEVSEEQMARAERISMTVMGRFDDVVTPVFAERVAESLRGAGFETTRVMEWPDGVHDAAYRDYVSTLEACHQHVVLTHADVEGEEFKSRLEAATRFLGSEGKTPRAMCYAQITSGQAFPERAILTRSARYQRPDFVVMTGRPDEKTAAAILRQAVTYRKRHAASSDRTRQRDWTRVRLDPRRRTRIGIGSMGARVRTGAGDEFVLRLVTSLLRPGLPPISFRVPIHVPDLEEVERAAYDGDRVILISGPPGSGRQDLARHLARRVEKLYRPHAFVDLNAQPFAIAEQAIDAVADLLEETRMSLRKHGLLALVENLAHPELCERLTQLWNSLVVVTTPDESYELKGALHVRIEPLETDAAERLLASECRAPGQVIRDLARLTGGRAGLLYGMAAMVNRTPPEQVEHLPLLFRRAMDLAILPDPLDEQAAEAVLRGSDEEQEPPIERAYAMPPEVDA